jgi:hypothetical protein
MQMRKKAGIILILIAAACSTAIAAEDPTLDPLSLRRRLTDSIGAPPWSLVRGYSMQGQFILKTTGEEISYKARYVRSLNRWAADFVQENQSRNLRYVISGKEAWISSPEITADALPDKFPYTVQFDFPMLYDELLLILERGKRDTSFRMAGVANEIYIHGKLRNGWQATFVLNTVEYFPRKVLIAVPGEPATAWLLPFAGPDGSCSLIRGTNPSSEFEIWFSDTVQAAGYRYARRMDFSENGSTVGTFILEENSMFSEIDGLFIRPPRFPWLESIRFTPRADMGEASLYLDESELHALRLRIKESPWDRWNRENRIIAYGAALMTQIGHIFPKSISLRLISMALAVCYIGFIILLIRRRRQFRRAFSWKLLVLGMLIACLVLAAGIASRQLHSSGDRSLFALHSAIRYAITGDSFFAGRADALLSDFAREAPADSIEELGSSCQAYALAYDLIRGNLPRARRLQIEEELFNYAKPLFGASRGWISNMAAGSALSAGLGMVGLAIGYEPFVTAACETIDKTLRTQLTGGLHTSGPGPGSLAMDDAANLFSSLKHAHRADYFDNTVFRQYVHATLQMISPVGALPLFGDTDLDQSARLSAFFLKVANQLPEEEGRRCIFAHNLYWDYGRYHAEGWARWVLPACQHLMMFFDNPYVLLQYTRALPPAALPPASVVLGNGQSAVLRAGADPDSIYLALNMARSNPETARRDILTFDLYAYRSLLLHGPGSPGRNDARYKETASTAAGNSITMNDENQSAAECTGIESSLLNQPLFDHLRALADKTYDYGRVQRDIVMVRPETNRPAYFILLDDVFTSDPGTTVQWHLHGRGTLETGIDRASRWISTAFGPRWFKSDRVILKVSHPLGAPGDLATKTGMLYSRISLLNQESASTTIEWTGSGRFGTILLPHKSGEAQEKIEPQGKDACRIGATDWISLGSLNDHVAMGPLAHISEYVIVRDRMNTFPALLMVSGLQCQFGPHSLFCTKPVTASLNGLRGGFLNPRPNTRVEIQSPEIQAGDRFRLDDEFVTAGESGRLIFTLGAAGEHSFSRAQNVQ